jgi:class 3 adenylate cyclase
MSDVEASTALWSRNGAAMDRAFAELSDELQRIVGQNGGTTIKARGEGDSHFAVFDRASSAARAAVELQRRRAAVDWPVARLALHTAEAEPCDGDYLGAMVNHTARLRAAAHGRQTLCSRVVADLIRGTAALDVRSLGTHRVRDVPDQVELFQVSGVGAPDDFPPPRTEDVAATPIMAFVVVDQVGSRRRVEAAPGDLAEWQGGVYRALRSAADARDGRFFKFVGDGCLVAFDDPVAAVGFAREVCESALEFRAAVSAGLTEIVEGEPSSLALWEAATHIGDAETGTVWTSPVIDALMRGTTAGCLTTT